MKKVSLLLIGLLCISLSSLAGEVITNNTGEDATGLRVVFSTPVEITAFGDILRSVDQTGLSYEFIFSGGLVPPWGSHWFNYAPATTRVMEYQWLSDTDTVVSGSSTTSWKAVPNQVDWLAHVQVPAFQVPLDLANSTFVTSIAWGSSWQMESAEVASLPEDTERLMASGRSYTMGFSPITTSEGAFFHRPELAQAACVNIDGERCILDWYPVGTLSPFYWGCTNNPTWQDYLVERCVTAVDLGVDAILLDEIYGTAHATWNAGGCFCEYCLAGFRDYLSQKYTAAELRRQFGISDISSFDYGDFIRNHGYTADWRSRRFWEIPLYGDYESFQNQAVVKSMRQVVTASRQYASDVYGCYLPFSANINDLNTAGLKFAELLDWFTCEVFYKDLGYPPSAKVLPLARLAAGLGKDAYFMTNVTTNADLMKQTSTDNLLRLLIADAYAGGGAYYLPYNIYAFDEATGTSPGSFTGELDEIADYFRFVLDNPFLFQGDTAASGIAVLFPFCSIDEHLWNPAHQPFLDLCAALYDGLLPYDVLVAGDSNYVRQSPSRAELAKYSVVFIPTESHLPSSLVRDLADFVNEGGTVLSYSESTATSIRNAGGNRARTKLLRRKPENYYTAPNTSDLGQMFSELPSDLLLKRIEIEDRNGNRVSDVNAWLFSSDGATAIHVVNYAYNKSTDSVAATGPVLLKLPLDYLGPELANLTVYLLSPSLGAPVRVTSSQHAGYLEVPIEEVGIWTVAYLVTSETEAQLLAETLEQLPYLADGFSAPKDFVAPVRGDIRDLVYRQQVLDAAWEAIERARPSAKNIAWDSIFPCLRFPASITPGFYCDGISDFSAARFWGRPGHLVRSVNVGISSEGLAVSVILHADDQLGRYGYIVAFRSGSKSFYAMLKPDAKEASLSLDDGGNWQDVGRVTGDLYQETPSEVRAWFPAEVFEAVVAPDTLLSWKIDFHIDYREAGRRELFFFPGSGYAVELPKT